MIIKRYIVNNMNEAMTRIRYELGKDAVIISQRKVRKPGIKGFFSKKVIEVTAAIENMKKNEDDVAGSLEALKKVMEKEIPAKTDNSKKQVENESLVQIEASEEKDSQDYSTSELLKEMQEMKNMLGDMMQKGPDKASRKTKLEIKLENSDVNEKIIKKMIPKVKAIADDINEEQKLKSVVKTMISISKTRMQGRIVLVGPTGVGKTTTIAKLAGKLSLIDKKKVGLITIDTYRIGAVDQLRTYADIMNIPFKVVFTIKEMEAAVESMKDCDVVLIDTTGRSSKNTMQISELRAFVDKVGTNNIHLVISCTTKNNDIVSIVEGYKVLKYNNVIITKLDETSTYGSILNILDCAKKPISYVTTGQNVPDDIKQMTVDEISNLILGEGSVC